MIALCLLGLAWGGETEATAIVDALQQELDRSVARLSLPDSPAIYLLRYKITALESQTEHASFGATVSRDAGPMWLLGVEVRVGDATFDNTGFGGWSDGFGAVSLPSAPTPESARADAWRVTDKAYKDAVEQYARKKAQAVLPPDHPGDYQLLAGPPVVVPLDAWPVAQALSGEVVRDLSAKLIAQPAQELADVWDSVEWGVSWTLDNQGTHVARPVCEHTTRLVARVRTADGAAIDDERMVSTRCGEGYEPRQAAADALAAELGTLTRAKRVTEDYVGPVVFLDSAATELFRALLLPQLEGTPPEIPFDSIFGDLGEGRDLARLHRRVLPARWRVEDLGYDASLPGTSMRYDDEGVRTEPVTAVVDGVVQDLWMSRTPRTGLAGSNGHGRSTVYSRAIGKAISVRVSAPKRLSDAALIRRALRDARAYALDHVYVVRRLEDPAIARYDDPNPDFPGDGPYLPPPAVIDRVYADGRVERVRGVKIASADRRVLRDVVAAGQQQDEVLLEPSDGARWFLGPTGGAPTRLSAPSVLVGELELVPRPPDPNDAHVLPPP